MTAVANSRKGYSEMWFLGKTFSEKVFWLFETNPDMEGVVSSVLSGEAGRYLGCEQGADDIFL